MNTKDLSGIVIVIRMKLLNTAGKQTTAFASIKLYCLVTLICPIILISHIAQLLLIGEFYCFLEGLHISFKYERHNHLRHLMMGEVSPGSGIFYDVMNLLA